MKFKYLWENHQWIPKMIEAVGNRGIRSRFSIGTWLPKRLVNTLVSHLYDMEKRSWQRNEVWNRDTISGNVMGYINGIIYIYISISIYGKCDGIYQHHKVEQDLPFFFRKNSSVIPSVPCWKTVTQVEFSAGISDSIQYMWASADMLAHPFISYQVGDTSHYIPIVFHHY